MARKPSLPSIVSKLPNDVRNFLQRVKEAFDGGFVSRSDLVSTGLFKEGSGGDLAPNDNGDYSQPPAPMNLNASGVITTIYLTWEGTPGYNNLAYTEIWRSGANNFGSAVLIATSQGYMFADSVDAGSNLAHDSAYYYWVRFVSRAGIVGPLNSTSGTLGETSDSPTAMLELLTGEITESQLYADLNTRIDLIDGPDYDPATVNARVLAEAQDRAQALQLEVQARELALTNEANARGDALIAEAASRTAAITASAEVQQLHTINVKQEAEALTETAAEGILQATLNAQDGFDRITAVKGDWQVYRDAAFYVDPADGAIGLRAIAAVKDEILNEVAVDLNAVDATLQLKADSTTVGAHQTWINETAITLNGMDSTITSKASSAWVNQALIDVVSGLEPYQTWEFPNSAEGWTGENATATGANSVLSVDGTATDPAIYLGSLNIDGSAYTQVIIKFKRTAGTGWVGRVYYTTAGHGYTSGYYKVFQEPFDDGQYHSVAISMRDLDAGADDWTTSTITGIKIALGADGSDSVDIDWIQVAKSSLEQVLFNDLEGRLTTAESTIDGQAGEIALKVAQTEFTTLEGTVSGHTATLALIPGEIAAKVSTADFDTKANTAILANSTIIQHGQDIALKASLTQVNGLGDRLDTAEFNIDAAAGRITQTAQSVYQAKDAAEEVSAGLLDGLLAQEQETARQRATLTRVALAEQTIAAHADAISSEASSRLVLAGVVGGNVAALSEESRVRADETSALVERVSNLIAAVTDPNSGRVYSSAGLVDEQALFAEQDLALATSFTGLSATVGAKNRTYVQESAPTVGLVIGDLWCKPSTGNTLHRYNGATWDVYQDDKIASTATRLDNIAEDNVLTPIEKVVLISEMATITGESPGLIASAATYTGTTYAAAIADALGHYTGALGDWTNYLDNLSPAWNSLSSETTIVRTTFNGWYAALATTRIALLEQLTIAAKGLSDDAQDTANEANQALTNIADNSIIDQGEKLSFVALISQINKEQIGISGEAAAFGISSATYESAVAALNTYLGSTLLHAAPNVAWNSLDGPTGIPDTTVFSSKFDTVYTTRAELLAAIAVKAQKLSDDAQKTADSKNKTFAQATAPVKVADGLVNGDFWIDTSPVSLANQAPKNTPHVWDDTDGWTPASDYGITAVDARVTDLDQTKIGYATLDATGEVFDNFGGDVVIKTGVTDPLKDGYANSVAAYNAAHPTNTATWHQGLPFAQAVKNVWITTDNGGVSIENQFLAQEEVNGVLSGKIRQMVISDYNAVDGTEGLAEGTINALLGVDQEAKRRWNAETRIAVAERTLETHASALEAEATSLELLAAVVGGNQSVLLEKDRVLTLQDSALVERITNFVAAITDPDTERVYSEAGYADQTTAWATQDQATATTMKGLSSVIGGNNATFNELYFTKTAANEAIASKGDKLRAFANLGSGKVFRQALAPTSRGADPEATGTQLPLLSGDIWIADSVGGTTTKVYDGRTPYAEAGWVVTADAAVPLVDARVTNLNQTQIGYSTRGGALFDAGGTIISKATMDDYNAAHPLPAVQVEWNPGLPLATAVKQVTVSSGLGGVMTLEEKYAAQETLNGTLRGQYTVKIDNNGFMSGFGLASEEVDGEVKSEFYAMADRFAIINPSDLATAATVSITSNAGIATATCAEHGFQAGDFVVIAGAAQGAYNGTQKVLTVVDTSTFTFAVTGSPASPATWEKPATVNPVYAGRPIRVSKSAVPFILDGGIVCMTGALIKDATIESAKIVDLTADKIRAGLVQAIDISGDKIIHGASLYLGGVAAYSHGAGTVTGDITNATGIESVTGADIEIRGGATPSVRFGHLDGADGLTWNAAGGLTFRGTATFSSSQAWPAGILNSNVTTTTIGAVNTDLSNAPSGILNSSLTSSIADAAKTATDWQTSAIDTTINGAHIKTGSVTALAIAGSVAADESVRTEMSNGNVITYQRVGGTDYGYQSLTHIEVGVVANNTVVPIPGYFSAQPRVIVSPANLQLYDAANHEQDQSINCQALNIELNTAISPLSWRFTAKAELLKAAASGLAAVNSSSGGISSNTYTSAAQTTEPNCSAITVNVALASARGDGSSQYFYRQVSWRVGYRPSGSAGSYTYTSPRVVAIGASTTNSVTDSMAVSLSAGTWQFIVEYTASDVSTAVFGALAYDYSTGTATGVATSVIWNPAIEGHTLTYTLNAYTPPTGWEVVPSGTVTYTYGLKVNVSPGYWGAHVDDSAGQYFYTSTSGYWSTLETQSFTKTSFSTGEIYAYSVGSEGTSFHAAGFAGAYIENGTATIPIRKPSANSTTPSNTFVLSSYNFSLSYDPVIAIGSVQWMAIGS